MTWLYVAVFEFLLNCALAYLLYLKGEKNGQLQERNATCNRLLQGQADAWGKFETRVKRYEDRLETIEKRNNNLDIATLPDPVLSKVWKNPTVDDLSTNPEGISDIEATREAVPRKI